MTKQELVAIDTETKNILDTNYRAKGYRSRKKYLKDLIMRDNDIVREG